MKSSCSSVCPDSEFKTSKIWVKGLKTRSSYWHSGADVLFDAGFHHVQNQVWLGTWKNETRGAQSSSIEQLWSVCVRVRVCVCVCVCVCVRERERERDWCWSTCWLLAINNLVLEILIQKQSANHFSTAEREHEVWKVINECAFVAGFV